MLRLMKRKLNEHIMAKKKVTAEFLLDKLEEQGVLLLREVRNAGGFAANRSLDGMSFGTWPSKGHHYTGYEVKISRADWKKELEQIEKAEAFRPYCKYFYLVTAKGIAEEHEIPETWGWLEWDGRRLRTIKKAPANKDIKPIPSGMMAAILKRCYDTAEQSARAHERSLYETKMNSFDKEVEAAVERKLRYGQRKSVAVDKFMEAIGKRSGEWEIEKLTENTDLIDIVKFYANHKEGAAWEHPLAKANDLVRRLTEYAGVLEEAQKVQSLIANIADQEALQGAETLQEAAKEYIK